MAMGATRRGYSLFELITVVLFIGVLAAVAIPRLKLDAISKQKADCVARRLVTDLRRTRTRAITHAGTQSEGFALRMSGTEPYNGYEIKNWSTGEVIDRQTIDSDVECRGPDTYRFGPLGNTMEAYGDITIRSKGRTFTISIVSATGMVKCVEN